MKAFGVESVGSMEFAWTLVEPEKGRYDFSLFDRAIAVLAEARHRGHPRDADGQLPGLAPGRGRGAPGLATADERFRHEADGLLQQPRLPRGLAPHSRACAEHYGQDERVVGWQIDNEIGHEGSDRCVCDNCGRPGMHGSRADTVSPRR